MERGFNHPVLCLRPQLSPGVRRGVTPGDRVGVGISIAKVTAPQSTGNFSTRWTWGPHPSSMIQKTPLPGSPNYSELTNSLSAPSLAVHVGVQGLPLASRRDSGTPRALVSTETPTSRGHHEDEKDRVPQMRLAHSHSTVRAPILLAPKDKLQMSICFLFL